MCVGCARCRRKYPANFEDFYKSQEEARLKALGLIDKIVSEPVGGAHRDHKQMAAFLKRGLNDAYRQVSDLKTKELLDKRYDKLMGFGKFTDTKAESR